MALRPVFVILATHLIVYDRMPRFAALSAGDVILPRPPAKLQLFDKIDLIRLTGLHDPPVVIGEIRISIQQSNREFRSRT